MGYTPPTLSTLVTSVLRDLRDGNSTAFSRQEVADLIGWAIVEVNRIYPKVAIEDLDVVDDGDGNPVRLWSDVSTVEVSRVEVWRNGVFREQVPQMGDASNSGWDLFGSNFMLPTWVTLDDALDTVKVYGYQNREWLEGDDDVLDSDPEAEVAVRLYAVSRGYQRLQNDRALFQQWLAIPGNKDISPTQLDGMANTYLADWNRHRQHARLLRR
jgi:hypothetical protein